MAHATVLKNGVRADDRSGLHIRRPPAEGGPRFRRPSAVVRPPAPPPERHGWFWEIHASAAGAGGPARWDAALGTLRGWRARNGPLTSPAAIREIAAAWREPIARAARAHRVSEALILAVIAVESSGRPKATSSKDARGLMQLIPATARRFGVADAYEPAANIEGGAAYLDFLLGKFGGDVILALAGYNAGENAVTRHGGVPPYRETRDYVVKVLDALAAAEAICLLPPESPRHACLWDVAAN
jgi:soluble lytic murein transglycosylase-like protein